MVVGSAGSAMKLGKALEQSSDYGIRLVGFFDREAGKITISKEYDVHSLRELPEMLQQDVIDEIIFAVDSGELAGMEEIFLLCDEVGVRTRVLVDFFPHVNSELYLDRLGAAPLPAFSAAPHHPVRAV